MIDHDIEMINNLVKIAYNQKPKNRKRTEKTRAEIDEILTNGVLQIQKQLIGYKCLQAAVKLSPDNKAISQKAVELITETLKMY